MYTYNLVLRFPLAHQCNGPCTVHLKAGSHSHLFMHCHAKGLYLVYKSTPLKCDSRNVHTWKRHSYWPTGQKNCNTATKYIQVRAITAHYIIHFYYSSINIKQI